MVNGGSLISPGSTVPEPQCQLLSVEHLLLKIQQQNNYEPLLYANSCTSSDGSGVTRQVLSFKCPWLECFANDLVSGLFSSSGPLQLLPITQKAAY